MDAGVIAAVVAGGGVAAMWGDLRSKVRSLWKWAENHHKESVRRDDRIAENRVAIAQMQQWQMDNQRLLVQIDKKIDKVI